MKYLVKDTPIRKNGKTYGVGEEYPYSDKDKKLLWNLTEVTEPSRSEVKEEIPKGGPTVTEQSRSTKNVEPKKATPVKKKTVAKKTTTKKGQSK